LYGALNQKAHLWLKALEPIAAGIRNFLWIRPFRLMRRFGNELGRLLEETDGAPGPFGE
jgi:hypothetical protein